MQKLEAVPDDDVAQPRSCQHHQRNQPDHELRGVDLVAQHEGADDQEGERRQPGTPSCPQGEDREPAKWAPALVEEGGKVTGKRVTEEGVFGLEAPTPAIVSVTEKSNTPRFAAFKGIMAAKKKTIEELSLEEIGVDAANVGLANAATSVSANNPKPPKSAGEIITDEGDGGKKLVEFLVKEKLV